MSKDLIESGNWTAEEQHPSPEDFNGEPEGIGCWNCDDGWKHGCMDDMCRNSTPADECGNGYPCRLCNPDGQVMF